MAYAFRGEGALDYHLCRYGQSRLLFRGPSQDISGDYVAVLGGTEAYGKYVPRPFPALMRDRLGWQVVNLGCVNAGPDVYLNDPGAIEVAIGAQAVVVQVMGAQNLSNRFYSVHPRRNDRFLRANAPLRALFPEVDFTEFNFTRHMLSALKSVSPDRFERVAEDLRHVWVERMAALLRRLTVPVVLLWMSDRAPPAPGGRAELDHDPLLVDSAMLAALRHMVALCIEVVGAGSAEGLVYGPLETAPAVPGPETHRAAADALASVLRRLLATP